MRCRRKTRGVPLPEISRPLRSRDILGMRVDVLSYDRLVADLLQQVRSGVGGRVCVANVHMVLTAYDDAEFRKIVNTSTYVTSDGMPLVWALRWLGEKDAERVYGPRLMECVLAAAERENMPVGLFGSTPMVLDLLKKRIGEKYPRLALVYSASPPFRPLSTQEEEEIASGINASGARILFVGLGCPKQEIWMARNEKKVNALMLGVGAAFDFLSGHKAQAPQWIQRIGMEWFFRLACEPRRLAGRYMRTNPRFVRLFLKQLRQAKRREKRKAEEK